MAENSLTQPCSYSRTIELALVGAVVVLAIIVRMRGISEQGLRFHDEGTYYQFGTTLLVGEPGYGREIFYKPGMAVLMYGAFAAFGHADSSALLLNSLAGIGTVILAWYLARRLAGRFAAFGTAAACAAMPYMLLYHRSAMTESPYFFLALASLTLVVVGLDRADREAERSTAPTLCFVAAGLCAGFGYAVNAPAALIWVLVVVGGVVHLRGRRVSARDIAIFVAANAVGFACGAAIPHAICSPFAPAETAFSPEARLGNILQFSPRFFCLRHLFRYAGPPALILAGLGAFRAWKTRHRFHRLLMILTAGLFLFYVQTDMTWPRLLFPLVLPVVLLAGFGVDFIAEHSGRTLLRRWGIVLALAAVMIGLGLRQSLPIINLSSGYREAARLLEKEKSYNAITFHGWTILSALTGRRFVADTGHSLFANCFEPGSRETPPQRIRKFVGKYGSTHLVVDYFFWKQLRSPAARERFARFLETNPPDKVIPNPIAGHRPTIAEDGESSLDILDDPNARSIYIWRLPLRRP